MPSTSLNWLVDYQIYSAELRSLHLLKDRNVWQTILSRKSACIDTRYCVVKQKHAHKQCTGYSQYSMLEAALRCFINYANLAQTSDQEHSNLKAQVVKDCYKLLEATKFVMVKVPESARPACFHLSNYEFIKPLTRGAYGQLFMLKSRSSNQLLAAKILSITEAQKLGAISSFLNERNILFQCNQMNSPFIVNMDCSFRSQSFLFLLCEYIDGGDLSCWLDRKGVFSTDETRIIASQLIRALLDLQQLGIVHGDVKPENMVYSRPTGCVKLIDFGLSFAGPVGKESSCRGTPEYMSPEQIRCDQKSYASDLWAMGVCIYEFLSGQPLFYACEPENILHQIVQFTGCIDWAEKDPKNVISKDGRDLITSLLSPDPMQRPSLKTVKKHPFVKGLKCTEVLKFSDEINFDDRNMRYSNGIRFYNTAVLESESIYTGKSQEFSDKDLVLYYPLQALYRC